MQNRELVVIENITLDGVIEATEGWFAPAGDDADVDQSDVEAALREHREAAMRCFSGGSAGAVDSR